MHKPLRDISGFAPPPCWRRGEAVCHRPDPPPGAVQLHLPCNRGRNSNSVQNASSTAPNNVPEIDLCGTFWTPLLNGQNQLHTCKCFLASIPLIEIWSPQGTGKAWPDSTTSFARLFTVLLLCTRPDEPVVLPPDSASQDGDDPAAATATPEATTPVTTVADARAYLRRLSSPPSFSAFSGAGHRWVGGVGTV